MAMISLVLDNLRSIHNVGSILRTADGLGVSQINYIGTSPYPALEVDERLPHRRQKQSQQLAKTALGAEKLLTGCYFKDVASFLKQANRPIVCLEQTETGQSLNDYQLSQSIYLVVGAEVDGVSAKLLAAAETCLEIPMRGQKESFNVAVACGIALYSLLN